MTTVKVSPKFQVVIPLEVRESMGIAPGEKVQVFQYENRIEFIPVKELKKMRGFLKGMDTSVFRDEDRRGNRNIGR
jgi:AbrB family looped-hinge helix DNA binding protein